jgi:hypothetical protein
MVEYNRQGKNGQDIGEYPSLTPRTKELAGRASNAVRRMSTETGLAIPAPAIERATLVRVDTAIPQRSTKLTSESPIHHWLVTSPAPHHHLDLAASPEQALAFLQRATMGARENDDAKMSIIVDTEGTDLMNFQAAADRRHVSHAVWPIHVRDLTEGAGPEEFVDTVSNIVSTYTDAQDRYTDHIRNITEILVVMLDGKTPKPEHLRDSLRVLIRRKGLDMDPKFSLTPEQQEAIDEGIYDHTERELEYTSFGTILAALNNTILRPGHAANAQSTGEATTQSGTQDPNIAIIRLPDNGIGNQYTKDALVNVAEAKVRHLLGSDKFKNQLNVLGMMNAQNHTAPELQRYINLAKQNGVPLTIFAYRPGLMQPEHFGFFGSAGHAGVMQSAGGNMDELSRVLGTQYGERLAGRSTERGTNVSAGASQSHSVTDGHDRSESGEKTSWFGLMARANRNVSESTSHSETSGQDINVGWGASEGEGENIEIGPQARMRTDEIPAIADGEVVLITRQTHGLPQQDILSLPLADAGVQRPFYRQLADAFPDIPLVSTDEIGRDATLPEQPTSGFGPSRASQLKRLDAAVEAANAATDTHLRELTKAVVHSGLRWEDIVNNGDTALNVDTLLPRQQEALRALKASAAQQRLKRLPEDVLKTVDKKLIPKNPDPIEHVLRVLGEKAHVDSDVIKAVIARDSRHDAPYERKEQAIYAALEAGPQEPVLEATSMNPGQVIDIRDEDVTVED